MLFCREDREVFIGLSEAQAQAQAAAPKTEYMLNTETNTLTSDHLIVILKRIPSKAKIFIYKTDYWYVDIRPGPTSVPVQVFILWSWKKLAIQSDFSL